VYSLVLPLRDEWLGGLKITGKPQKEKALWFALAPSEIPLGGA